VDRLPAGTVTFLFADIEGSTRLVQRLGDRYGDLLRDFRRVMRDRLEGHDGQEIDTQGDALFFSFPRARDAVAGSVAAQRALAEYDWPDGTEVRVRMGLHTGEPAVGEEGYHGIDVVRAARICAAGHGGQILLSETTRALTGDQLPEGVSVHDLGRANLKDVQHERIYQLAIEGQPTEFPPLRAETPAVEHHAEDMATKAQSAIEQHVLAEIERSLGGGKPTRPLVGLAAGGLVILLLVVLALAAIVLIVRSVL
jgi:class 3 adenylate cyclase